MNLLFAVANSEWGGVKSWALETATVLRARGHRCVMVGRRGNPWVAACREAGLPAHGLPFEPPGNPLAVVRLALLARAAAADLLVVNNHLDLVAGCLAGALARRPVVRRVGRPDDLVDSAFERLLYRRFLIGLLTVGHRAKADMLRRCPWLRAESIEVIHIGKDPARFRPERRRTLQAAWGLGPDAVLFGVTSRLSARKGHPELLDALARVVRLDARVHLAVVGAGDQRARLERQAAALALTPRVRFLGFRRDLPDLLASLDAFVLPSQAEAEAFPNTLVEAMASGLACVATDVSSVGEILADGETGLLVAPGDVGGLATAMGRLAADPALRRRLGAAARDRVERDFSLEAKVTELERYLERLRPRAAG